MAVGSHLGIEVAEYDARIRTFVPYYVEMLDESARLVDTLAVKAPVIVELGIGSGALAARCLARRPDARVIGVDADPAMLALARARLARHGTHVELRQGRFDRLSLPRCHVVVASLALHHVRTRRTKLAVYGRIAGALEPSGLVVSADCIPASATGLADRGTDAWRAHLRQTYSARQTNTFLESWSEEDRYQPLHVELALLGRAGFTADVAWRRESFAVLVGTRPIRTASRGTRLRRR